MCFLGEWGACTRALSEVCGTASAPLEARGDATRMEGKNSEDQELVQTYRHARFEANVLAIRDDQPRSFCCFCLSCCYFCFIYPQHPPPPCLTRTYKVGRKPTPDEVVQCNIGMYCMERLGIHHDPPPFSAVDYLGWNPVSGPPPLFGHRDENGPISVYRALSNSLIYTFYAERVRKIHTRMSL